MQTDNVSKVAKRVTRKVNSSMILLHSLPMRKKLQPHTVTFQLHASVDRMARTSLVPR